jgi:HSP20 family protein
MSERWWGRRGRPWLDIFEEFDRLEELMDSMMRNTFEIQPSETSYRPYVHGFSMSAGPAGKPMIREFGNVQWGHGEPKIREEWEPLVDILEEAKDLLVIIELPGVAREDIHLHVAQDWLTVSVDTPNRKYQKELKLPAKVDAKSSGASYRNGVLEVRLRKPSENAGQGDKILVE